MIKQPWRKALKRTLLLATDARVLTAPVIIACAILTILIHLAPNGSTVHGSVLVRILLACLGYVPGLVTIAIFVAITKNLKNENLRISLMLTSYFLAGALRGVVLSIGFFSLGMADALNLDFRIPGSALPFGLAIAVATYAVVALDESRARISSLRALEAEMTDAVRDSADQNAALRDRTISKIEASIQLELRPLTTISTSTSADELKSIASEVVRPLSHSLAERVPSWHPRSGKLESIRWRDIFSQLKPELSLRPVLLTALAMGTGITAFIYFFGIRLAIPMFLCSAVTLYFSTRAMQAVAKRLPPISSLPARAGIMTAMLIVLAIPASLINAIITINTSDPTFSLRAALLIVPVFGWFIALGGAAQAETARIESDYAEKIARLSWLRARLNLMNWYEQGELARVLHGPIQSIINKAVILLKGADSASTVVILEELRTNIQRELAPERRWKTEGHSFERMCADLSFTWTDVCKIDFAISPLASATLNNDAAATSLAWDIIHECCNNAVQHGKATWVSVRVEDPSADSVHIEIMDNGSQYEMHSKPGLGSNMMEACTVDWSRSRRDNQTRIDASLPIQR